MSATESDQAAPKVTLWLDPVCPFSWNTARWLRTVAERTGLAIDWQLMSLAVLNEGRELPPAQQARMRDSKQIGRLMSAVARQHGVAGWTAAYFAFGERYFDRSEPVDANLVAQVLMAAGARGATAAAVSDESLDESIRQQHQAGQDALGETGGSPILRIGERTFFGPVLTGVPAADDASALFDAVETLANTPQFAQLQRPRTAA
ncbi:mycothiol-dependent nitroreductase Rv2466c family protein [Mycobacterium colombiense]|uniref:mycothiol-dependent nitroreductase Rv2466c family protein n=1 Tax=Mycobacterium colombiense TaxID=339268 RepID=UPI00097CE64E|nr:DsbA family protein [Mycobacterium colombiense]MCK8644997.1 DsbA family protein [Mycobacterium colombiense]